jgi:hypothetical protein
LALSSIYGAGEPRKSPPEIIQRLVRWSDAGRRKQITVSRSDRRAREQNYARKRKIDFAAINNAAASYIPSLVRIWLPDGRCHGREWVALNPRRGDKRLGSFSINTVTGQWADFATGDRGGRITNSRRLGPTRTPMPHAVALLLDMTASPVKGN